MPSAERLATIGAATGVSIDWLLLGRGSKSSTVKAEESREIDGSEAVQRFGVSASAGDGAVPAEYPEMETVDVPRWVLERFDLKRTNARVLSATGISMVPTIGDGDLLLIDVSKPARMPVDGSIYVLSIDDALFVKRLRRSSEGWVLVSDNREMYPEEPITPGRSVTVHGRVVWADRKLS